jgi:hypothetical protein
MGNGENLGGGFLTAKPPKEDTRSDYSSRIELVPSQASPTKAQNPVSLRGRFSVSIAVTWALYLHNFLSPF